MAGMSPLALSRCRKLLIRKQLDGHVKLEVTDPRLNGKVVAEYLAKNAQDEMRVKRSYMAQYRIPPENITVVESKVEQSKAV